MSSSARPALGEARAQRVHAGSRARAGRAGTAASRRRSRRSARRLAARSRRGRSGSRSCTGLASSFSGLPRPEARLALGHVQRDRLARERRGARRRRTRACGRRLRVNGSPYQPSLTCGPAEPEAEPEAPARRGRRASRRPSRSRSACARGSACSAGAERDALRLAGQQPEHRDRVLAPRLGDPDGVEPELVGEHRERRPAPAGRTTASRRGRARRACAGDDTHRLGSAECRPPVPPGGQTATAPRSPTAPSATGRWTSCSSPGSCGTSRRSSRSRWRRGSSSASARSRASCCGTSASRASRTASVARRRSRRGCRTCWR